jgi:hypothetical protein
MSYLDKRFVLVDGDADLELEGRSWTTDDHGPCVELTLRQPLRTTPDVTKRLLVRLADWDAFHASVRREVLADVRKGTREDGDA